MLLSQAHLKHAAIPEANRKLADNKLPERVIQIGEGNFLRGFFDWLIHQLNKSGHFLGSVVVVSPRQSGGRHIDQINRQDGLYTVWLRGERI